MPIQKLSTQLANQIAAGEVVERPASVVKELVENSLDAGASRIDIEIERGGHKRIRIRDNGSGIAKQELALALAPYATSKIETLTDLEAIGSLGFRGEALASISAVSRLTLTSKTNEQAEAWAANTQGREMAVSLSPAAHPQGTTLDVVDLFYNTPARRKFLRAEKTEFQHIEDIIKRIALSRPTVSFSLKHNGKLVKQYLAKSTASMENRIQQICGNSFIDKASHAQLEYEGVSVNAWVGGQELMRSSTDMQFSFVNGRAMRDKLILHAIRQAYETVLGAIEQPAYVLFIDLSPNDVDVNVHPAKHEVRFHDARRIHDLICRVVQEALQDTSQAESTTTAPVHHDYIRPIQSNGGATMPQPHSVGHSSTSRPRVMNEPKRSSGAAFANYQTLMSPTDVPAFQQLAELGLIQFNADGILWLSASALTSKWLTAAFSANSVAQPLLMPVSIQFDDDVSWCQCLRECNLTLEISAGKLMLREVPASLRNFAWVKLLPVIAALRPTSKTALVDTIVNAAEHDESLQQQIADGALAWFKTLPVDTQQQISDSVGITKEIGAFMHWINS